jgi:hypothetical protein
MCSSVARKWIELNWLRRGNKEIPLPDIIFEKIELGSGLYYKPEKSEIAIEGRFYDLSNGLIVISPIMDSPFTANTIAHEWRHHWQFISGIKSNPWSWNFGSNYKDNIINFFNSSSTEMDAFNFALNKAPDDTSLLWKDWLVKGRFKLQ